jgi:4-amino-4-deoxy-L-arabinose transferase-like glycosyltransferase
LWRVPRPLLLLTLAVLIHNIAWMVVLPAWQGPDEYGHYAYVERLAADHKLMPFDDYNPGPGLSAAMLASMEGTGFNEQRFRLALRPFGPAGSDGVHFPREKGNLKQHNTGQLGTNNYPPAYYVAALPLFELPGLSNATQRDYAVRLLSALLGALVVPLTYRLGRLVSLSRRAALVAAGVATSAPILTQQSAVVSPDILLVVAITGLAAATLRARDRLDRRTVGEVLAWGAVAGLTKPIGLPAAVAVALPIAILTFGELQRRVRIALLAGASLVGVVLGSVFASTLFGFAVPASISWVERLKFAGEYLWQYYLPRPSGMPVVLPPATPASPPAAWMWGKEGVGILGWLTTPLPNWAYRLAWWPTLVAGGIAFAGGLFGAGRDRSRRSAVLALVVASLAYILVLHSAEAVYMLSSGNRLLQGRYFLPIYPLIAVAIMAGLSRFGERVALSVGLVLWAAWTLVAIDALNTMVIYFG